MITDIHLPKCQKIPPYNTARPPISAAPIIPQAAVSRGAAAPLEVAVAAVPLAEEEELDPELLWAWPSAVDSLALRAAAAPEKGVAVTPVLFLQTVGDTSSLVTADVKVTSAHCWYYCQSVIHFRMQLMIHDYAPRIDRRRYLRP